MARLRVKTGCKACKQRKKKCDEQHPVCSNCERLNLVCQYFDRSRAKLEPETWTAVELHTRALTTTTYRNDQEGAILGRIISAMSGFFSPMSRMSNLDLTSLWYMLHENELVRNATVSCFSMLMGGHSDLQDLQSDSYGRALKLLQAEFMRGCPRRGQIMPPLLAVMWLGKMNSWSADISTDPLVHWIALIRLFAHTDVPSPLRAHAPPFSEYLLSLESLVFNVPTKAIFAKDIKQIQKYWSEAKIEARLRRLNPRGSDQMSISPLMSGQYVVFLAALRVTYYLRYPPLSNSEEVLDALELTVTRKEASLGHEFGQTTSNGTLSSSSIEQEILYNIYQVFCKALLIAITAVRPFSPSRRRRIDALISEALSFLSSTPLGVGTQHPSKGPHFAHGASWPMQIILCALSSEAQLAAFMVHFDKVKVCMDMGSHARSELLLASVKGLIASSPPRTLEVQDCWPPAMQLLRNEYGVLSI